VELLLILVLLVGLPLAEIHWNHGGRSVARSARGAGSALVR
jgi:hypothetical protein